MLFLFSFWNQIGIIVLIDIKWIFLSSSTVLLAANKNNVARLNLKHLRLLGEKEHVNSSNIYMCLFNITKHKTVCKPVTSCIVLFSDSYAYPNKIKIQENISFIVML